MKSGGAPVEARASAAWVDPACALCGGRERTTRFRSPPFEVVRCRCGLVYVTPRRAPEALLREVYDEGYWRSDEPGQRGYGDYLADADLYLKTFRRRWRALEARVPVPPQRAPRALEIGCAAGYFLSVLREHGWDVLGVEPSAVARAAARQRLGADTILAGTLCDVPRSRGPFDLIALWDVVEHVVDPRALLADAAARLLPGGCVVLETQNVASAVARLLGPRWHHFKHDEHLHHFDRRTLTRLLQGAGLAPTWMGAAHAGKYVSPAFLTERSTRLSPILRGPLRWAERLLPRALYVNPRDELIAVARRGET